MEDLFKTHIRSKNILDLGKTYLLAISGGIDSVCLGYLLFRSGYTFSLAHINFQLRGKESDGDENFVRDLAKAWDVPLFMNKTNKKQFMSAGISTQMGARDFRYQWFDELVKENGFDAVLIAHQFEDQIETVFLNLLRGTGIEGIYGMAERRGNIIRPLLPFSRLQITDFMEENGYSWRNDSSNYDNDYKRNLLRNRVLPTLSEDFEGGLQTLDLSFKRLKDTGKAFFELFETWKKDHIKSENDYQYLEIREIKSMQGRQSMVYYWLRDYGFSYFDVQDILQSIELNHLGKVFYSGQYILNKDRDLLILGKNDFEWRPLEIHFHDIELKTKNHKFDILHLEEKFEIVKSSKSAMLDLEKLEFPLLVKKWEQGDRFIPLGMENEKKISDLLVDLKVPLIQKKQVLVLWSGGKIAWVIGLRISEEFKCSQTTKKVLYFKKI